MKIYRLLVLVGGMLLMVGAALPWERWSSGFVPIGQPTSGYTTGLALSRSSGRGVGSSAYTAAAGGILVLIALIDKGRPGKVYSKFAVTVSVICGLVLGGTTVLIANSFVTDMSSSPAFGLLYVSPLGALLGILGGIQHVPQGQPQAAATWWVMLAFVVFTLVVLLALRVLGHIMETPFSTINRSLSSINSIPTPTSTPIPATPTPPPFMTGGDFGILSKEPCGPPCFLGIRPGVTTVDEAALILQSAGAPCGTITPRKSLNCQSGSTLISVSGERTVDKIDLAPPARITLGEFIAKYGPPDSVVLDAALPTFFYDSLQTFVLLAWQPSHSYTVTPGTTIYGVEYLTAAEYQRWLHTAENYQQPWKGYGTYTPKTKP